MTNPAFHNLELYMGQLMWRWAFADAAGRQILLSELDSRSDGIQVGIEFYLCEILETVPLAQRNNWWLMASTGL
jgi:hypothetical protein